MTSGRRLATWGFLLALAAAGVVVATRLRITTDITHFLPAGEDQELARVSRALADAEVLRTRVLLVDSAHPAEATRALRDALSRAPGVAWIRSGPEEANERAFFDVYASRRFAFAASSATEARALATDDALRSSARALRAELASPASSAFRSLAPRDPMLLFAARLQMLQTGDGAAPQLDGDVLLTDDRRTGIVTLATTASPFDSAQQAVVQRTIDAATDTMRRRFADLRVTQSGVARFASAAEASIRSDVERVSTLSTLGIVIVFLLVFRSIRYVALGLLPVIAGTVAALGVTLLAFGEVHGLTLAFGSSLVGAGVDYAEHYFHHALLAPGEHGPEASMRRIWPGLLLGAVTTIAGLAGLAWTTFPGIREVALFSAVGVTASLVATRLLLPPLMPRKRKPLLAATRLAEALARGVRQLRSRRDLLLVVPVAAVLLAALGLPRVSFTDDISVLNTVDPRVRDEDAAVRARLGKTEAGRYVVVLGRDDEEALLRNDAVATRLRDARSDGLLAGYRSLHTWLRSTRLQEDANGAFGERRALASRMLEALRAEGFRADAFTPFVLELSSPAPAPLRFADLRGTPLEPIAQAFRVDVSGQVALLTPVSGVRDPSALMARLRDVPGAHWLDQRALLSHAYGRFRARTFELAAVGLGLALLLVIARYRSVRLGLAAVLPAVLACGLTLAVFGLCDARINLMHVIGLLLVVSMGEDYGVFLVESRDDDAELGVTMLGVIVAMLTTVLSFGLLGLSVNPALRAIGTTAALGILLATLLAPTALVLLQPHPRAKGQA